MIVGIGNSLIDLTFHTPSLDPFDLTPESAQILPFNQWNELRDLLGKPASISPGGSACNTIAGLAGLGENTGFIGLVGNDNTGNLLKKHLNKINVDSYLASSEHDHPTGCCIVIVTPDGKRTMATCIGAASHFAPHHVPANIISSANTILLEGYLFDHEDAQQAFIKAASTAKEHNTSVAFSLSDPSCVRNHKEPILKLLPLINILFSNAEEAMLLTNTSSPADACSELQKIGITNAAITLEDKGALTLAENTVKHTPAFPISHVVDLNGAGDAFAAGFLFALTHNVSFHDATKTANSFAARVVETHGSRLNAQDYASTKKRLIAQEPKLLS
jgi:sugar/nucleoside kinase (ribokinase family)